MRSGSTFCCWQAYRKDLPPQESSMPCSRKIDNVSGCSITQIGTGVSRSQSVLIICCPAFPVSKKSPLASALHRTTCGASQQQRSLTFPGAFVDLLVRTYSISHPADGPDRGTTNTAASNNEYRILHSFRLIPCGSLPESRLLPATGHANTLLHSRSTRSSYSEHWPWCDTVLK